MARQPFVYHERTQASIQHHATRQGGDFQGFVRDDFRLFRPDKGENCVRILPATWEGAEHYGLDIYVHHRVGVEKASVLCLLRMLREPCPICEAIEDLGRSGDDVKELGARLSVLAWVLNRKKEQDGLLLWSIPPSLDREIQKHSQDRRTGTFYVVDNPYEGYDIYFDKSGDGLQTRYEGVTPAREPTSVDQDWLDQIAEVPVPDTLAWRTYDEVALLFSGGVSMTRRAAAGGNGSRRPLAEAPPTRRIAAPTAGSNRPARDNGAPPARAATPPPRLAPTVATRRAEPPPDVDDEVPFEGGDAYQDEAPARSAPPQRRAPPPATRTNNSGGTVTANELRDRFAQRGR